MKFQTMNHFWSNSFVHREFIPYNCMECDFKTAVLKTFQKHLVKEHKIKYDVAIHNMVWVFFYNLVEIDLS
jgi:hypothetical protein